MWRVENIILLVSDKDELAKQMIFDASLNWKTSSTFMGWPSINFFHYVILYCKLNQSLIDIDIALLYKFQKPSSAQERSHGKVIFNNYYLESLGRFGLELLVSEKSSSEDTISKPFGRANHAT